VPLTDAYALRGVARYGSITGRCGYGARQSSRGALACGLLVEVIAARHLIWSLPPWQGSAPSSARAATPKRSRDGFCSAGWRDGIAARAGLSRPHRAGRADPRQPRRLLHLRLHHLAGITASAGCDRRVWVWEFSQDRSVRAVAAITLPASNGGDRRLSAVVRWLITAQEPSVAVLAVVQLGTV